MSSSSLCRVVILGDGGVGKSCVTIQLTQNIFVTEYDPTVENTYRKQVTVDNDTVMLDILDTAGQEDYSILRDQYIRTGHGFLIVYSITALNTFKTIPEFRQKILGVKDVDEFPMVLLGNKCDLEKERDVTTTEGQELAKSFGIPFFETSAKARINIEEGFHQLVREIRKYNAQQKIEEKESVHEDGVIKRPKRFKFCLLL